MLARNERQNVDECFSTLWDHVDQVALCDTGSDDGTVEEAERFRGGER